MMHRVQTRLCFRGKAVEQNESFAAPDLDGRSHAGDAWGRRRASDPLAGLNRAQPVICALTTSAFDEDRAPIIRADPLLRELPVIARTAHALQGDEERLRSAGLSDYISKPIDEERQRCARTLAARPATPGRLEGIRLPGAAGSLDVAEAAERLLGFGVEW